MKKQILALLIIAMFIPIFGMEWQGDDPEEISSFEERIEAMRTTGGDYPFLREAIYKDPYLLDHLSSDELEFLKAVEDNDEELVKQYLSGEIGGAIRAIEYDPESNEPILHKSSIIYSVLGLARKIALQTKNYNIAKIIERGI